MNKVGIIAVILLSGIERIQAQTPGWLWANGAGGNNLSTSAGIATDAGGNVVSGPPPRGLSPPSGGKTLDEAFAGLMTLLRRETGRGI